MSKLPAKKIKKNKPNGIKKGRVEKKKNNIKKDKNHKKNVDKPRKLQNGKRNKRVIDDSLDATIKKKPSKVELKSVIERLQDNPDLVLVRKALKYTPFYLKSEGLTKRLLKEIIRLWAEAGEKVRVVCLLCLVRIYTKLKDKERKQDVIKKLYNSFLDKCRITKKETMSMIGFMRHSLIELYKLDPSIAFKQAQTACQQLTLTLKNANTHKNEETYKTVLNWQFCNCLILLSSLISSQDEDSPVKTLTHQVIQLNLGAINLLTSPRYYPFYCHLIENLINLSISTKMFIPIIPLIISILEKLHVPLETKKNKRKKVDSNKKLEKKKIKKKKNDSDEDDESEEDVEQDHDEEDDDTANGEDGENKKKDYNMELLNHVSSEECHSKEYTEAVLDKIYELLLCYLASQCHRIAFPELVLLPCVQLKKWLKKNPGKASHKFKGLLELIKTDCAKVEEQRKSVDVAFTNYTGIDAWEKRFKDSNKLVLINKFKTVQSDAV